MSTTALLVEILIIGFEVILWMLLIINPLAPELTDSGLIPGGNQLVAVGALAAAAYVLGIIADKSAKWVVEESSLSYLFLFNPVLVAEAEPDKKWPSSPKARAIFEWLWRPKGRSIKLKRPTVTAEPSSYLEQYAAVAAHSKDFMSDLFYGRSKVRILRASIFNLPLILLMLTVNLITGLLRGNDEPKMVLLILIGAVGLLLSLLLSRWINWLYCYNRWLYRHRLDYFYRIVQIRWRQEDAG